MIAGSTAGIAATNGAPIAATGGKIDGRTAATAIGTLIGTDAAISGASTAGATATAIATDAGTSGAATGCITGRTARDTKATAPGAGTVITPRATAGSFTIPVTTPSAGFLSITGAAFTRAPISATARLSAATSSGAGAGSRKWRCCVTITGASAISGLAAAASTGITATEPEGARRNRLFAARIDAARRLCRRSCVFRI